MIYKYPLIVFIIVVAAFNPILTFAQTEVLFDTTSGGTPSTINWGEALSTNKQRIAQEVTLSTSHLLCSVDVLMRRIGSPVDSVRLQVWIGDNEPQTGSIIAQPPAQLGSAIPTTETTINFALDNCVFIQAGQNYFYVFDRTGALDNSDKYNTSVRTTGANGRWSFVPASGGWVVDTNSQLKIRLLGIDDLSFFSEFDSSLKVTQLETTCDPSNGVFVNSLCKMFLFLFVPNEAVLLQFENLKDDIENKPPFGFFLSIKSELENLQDATATTVLPDLSAIQDTFLTPLKTGIIFLLFFLLAFWFFSRFRNFDL